MKKGLPIILSITFLALLSSCGSDCFECQNVQNFTSQACESSLFDINDFKVECEMQGGDWVKK